HHRSLFIAVPLGTLPKNQNCHKTAYVAGPTRRHPKLYLHLCRQAPSRECSGRAHYRAWRFFTSWTAAISPSIGFIRCIKQGNFLVTRTKSNTLTPTAVFSTR